MAEIIKIHRKLKGVGYRVRIRRKGSKGLDKTFDRKADAEAFIHMYDSAEDQLDYVQKKEALEHTLREAIDRYVEEEHINHLKTFRDRVRQLRFFKENFGTLPLAELAKPATIAGIQSKIQNHRGKDKKLTNATVNRYLSALSHLCQVAYQDWYWLESNPLRTIRRKKEHTKHGRSLTTDEFNNLKEKCEEDPANPISIIVMLALCTGMRKGEIRNLTWEDVNLKERTIYLKDTKNGSARVVPIVEPVLSMLKAHSKIRDLNHTWVFIGDNSYKTGMPYPINKNWEKLKKKAEITDFRFHDLRHTCASFLAKQNISTRMIAEILGHKTLAMAMRYSHVNVDDQRESLEIMTRKVFSNE